MNSNQDNSSDAVYNKLLAWLQHDSGNLPVSGQAQELVRGTTPKNDALAAELEMDDFDPLDGEELNFEDFSDCGEAAPSRQPSKDGSSTHPKRTANPSAASFKPVTTGGDIPTVQNRFQALLKRRLQAEIERRPPLFPWETELHHYEPDLSDDMVDRWVPPFSLWTAQLQNFSSLSSVPETVLAQLLESCTEVVQSRLQLGAKMVRAVLPLFPDNSQSLNQLANMVLLYPSRSPQEQQLFTAASTQNYEAATPDQKMALSLLAARELINALTLPVSPNQSPVERQWQTAAGLITLTAQYCVENGISKIRVQSRLPKGGSLTLRTAEAEATSQRTYPGYLSVESFDLQPNQTYPIEIQFLEQKQKPLTFAIRLVHQ